MEMNIKVIGYVRNKWDEKDKYSADSVMRSVSIVEVKEEFSDGLFKIDKYKELNIIFYFDRSEGYKLKTITHSGDYRGVFACCSPFRPSSIGVTCVNLIERRGNMLKVTGLDAMNNTPVLDIKPFTGLQI
ncbi:MAG TPA: SAM-dependent methyltransferase [Bacteroidales bacterium]|nr:SAM-dependent methyltransferase [Bacteroidales bacterium]